MRIANYCVGRSTDLASIAAFDSHRVGSHRYDFAEGLALGFEDGRRCMDEEEMRATGLEFAGRGSRHPEAAERFGDAFALVQRWRPIRSALRIPWTRKRPS